jgi:Fe-S cluster assembly ATPase SufC
VEEWGPTNYHLRSLSDQSLMIIMHPEDDILLIKVMSDPEEITAEDIVEKYSKKEIKGISSPGLIQEQIRAKLQEVAEPLEEDLQEKTVEDLRKLAIEQERQILVNKVREHFPGGSKRSNYVAQSLVLERKTNGKS